MDTKDYTIDELILLFEKHSKKFWIDQKMINKKYPESVDNEYQFCICDAMLSMCKAIKTHTEIFLHLSGKK